MKYISYFSILSVCIGVQAFSSPWCCCWLVSTAAPTRGSTWRSATPSGTPCVPLCSPLSAAYAPPLAATGDARTHSPLPTEPLLQPPPSEPMQPTAYPVYDCTRTSTAENRATLQSLFFSLHPQSQCSQRRIQFMIVQGQVLRTTGLAY